jgi:hypothetical protein
VFAADVLLIPGTCSRIDFEATKLYFKNPATAQDKGKLIRMRERF